MSKAFDVRAKKLNPDFYLSGLSPDEDLVYYAVLAGFMEDRAEYFDKYYDIYGNYIGSEHSSFHRQISKDGGRSLNLGRIVQEDTIENFTFSMIAMPVVGGKRIIDSDQFHLVCKNYSEYELSIRREILTEPEMTTTEIWDYHELHGEYPPPVVSYEWETEKIPFDNTCHYIGVSKTDTKLVIDIDGRRSEFILDQAPADNFSVFDQVEVGQMYVDKVFFSKSGAVLDRGYYQNLIPAKDVAMIVHSTFTDWVFRYDEFDPRILTAENASVVNGYNVIGLNFFNRAATVLRNRSGFDVEISFDTQTWLPLREYEYIPSSIEHVLIRSLSPNFEVIQDSFGKPSLNLAAADVEITGDVYPYHRDEPTYYTNAEYNFSNATLTVTPIDDPIKTVEVFGKLSDEILTEMGVTTVVKNGREITPEADFIDNVPHFYTLSVDWAAEKKINENSDKYMCINALGFSVFPQTIEESREVFNRFSGNTAISVNYELSNVVPGSINNGPAHRVIDVQWPV